MNALIAIESLRQWVSFLRLIGFALCLFVVSCQVRGNEAIPNSPSPTTTPTTFPVSPASETVAIPLSATPDSDNSPLESGDGVDNFLLFEKENGIYQWRAGEESQFVIQGSLPRGQPVSPDNNKLLIDMGSANVSALKLLDLQTGQTESLELLLKPSEVFWSPNGEYLIYVIWEDQQTQLVLFNFETKENRVLAQSRYIISEASWSPDSEVITFIGDLDGQFDLYTYHIVTQHLKKVTHTPELEVAAIWSPIGEDIVLGTNPYGLAGLSSWPYQITQLSLVNYSGENRRLLGDSYAIHSTSLVWSFDGQKLAFSDSGNLCILDVETLSNECPLEETFPPEIYYIGFNSAPVWSADNERLAFRATNQETDTCEAAVYVLEVETKIVTAIDRNHCSSGVLYWSRP
jgi:hypothetical protein